MASVTVVADTCAEADAWATALTVMGQEQAIVLANELEIAVYIIARKDKAYVASFSETFSPLLSTLELREVE